ncbi:MAG: OmpA family protein [bacterium]|nr:OmpA family protein [bacterium]
MRKGLLVMAALAAALYSVPTQAALLGGDDLAKCKNDMVATELKYKYCYKDKISAERELEQLRRQYNNETANFKKTIADLERQLESLTSELEALRLELTQEKDLSAQRIAELNATIDILRTKSSGREQELMKAQKEAEARYQKQIADLQQQLKDQGDAHRKALETLRQERDAEVAKLQQMVDNLTEELASLKKLTKAQKEELERLKAQEDELAKQLEKEIQAGEIRLKKFHDKLIINVDNRISFDSGSAELKKEVFVAFKKIGKILASYPENRIMIEGHTDNDAYRGSTFKDNWELSTERALSVLRNLLKNQDLDPNRFSAVGYSEYQPIVPNDSSQNKALNRRVDIVVVPRAK